MEEAGFSDIEVSDTSSDDSRARPKPLTGGQRLQKFLSTHWRGIITIITPIICIAVLPPFPAEPYKWCGYCLLVMAIYWVTECIPLQVTSFLPVVIFPITNVMNTSRTCACYMNETIMMFLGSIMLASAIEQSGLHRRIALCVIKCIGCSHCKMLFAVCFITMFFSMWITNTAATVMMCPIMFALLDVYEKQKLLKIYDTNPSGDTKASQITTCYFCAITFSATIGGIGTLVGTATNLVFKGLFMEKFPGADEYLSFPLFSAFSVPYMILMEIFLFIYLLIVYTGCFRPESEAAKTCKITPIGLKAADKAVADELKALGKITMHEILVLLLFITAIMLFFTRSPKFFDGWGDLVALEYLQKLPKDAEPYPPAYLDRVKDSTAAMLVLFFMFLLPSSLRICENFKAKFKEQLPDSPTKSLLDWHTMNRSMPYSFMFLLGGGFALSTAAAVTGLNQKIGETLKSLSSLPNEVILLLIIILTIFLTNFASNVAVANVIVPIVMQLALEVKQNPLWYVIAAGFSASYCFLLPVGTPGNLVVQSVAKIPTSRMICAGAGPTFTTTLISWVCIYLYAPIIWPTLKEKEPDWTGGGEPPIF